MVNLDYYGQTPGGAITFLEFGSINLLKSKKEVYDIRKDQQAYDWYMLGRYANDIYVYDTLIKDATTSIARRLQTYTQEIHHKHDLRFNFYKMLSLKAIQAQQKDKTLSFYELGQTLFGCIEGMMFSELVFKDLQLPTNLDLDNLDWYGVDISPFFNYLSEKFHPNHKIYAGVNFDHLPKQLDVFFAKGVTMLYAVCTAQSIVELITRCQCGYFDYSFSLKGEQLHYIPTGKQVTYVEFDAFLKLAKQQNLSIIANQNTAKINADTNRIYVECFYGTQAQCDYFAQVLNAFEQRLFEIMADKPEVIQSMMDSQHVSKWVPLEQLIK